MINCKSNRLETGFLVLNLGYSSSYFYISKEEAFLSTFLFLFLFFYFFIYYYFTVYGAHWVHRFIFGKSKQQNQEIMPVLVYVLPVVSKYCNDIWEASIFILPTVESICSDEMIF